jgi:phosphatidylglycerophosphatase A
LKYIKEKIIVNPDYKVDFFSKLFSSGLFVGYIPKASGTFGSLFGLLFFLIPRFIEPVVLIPVIIVVFFIGVFVSQQMTKRYGDDPSVVVIDEIVGMWISVLIISSLFDIIGNDLKIISVLVAFLTFRFFDIIKLQPAKYFDKLKNGFGIMMDDVVAGIYAGIVSYLIISFLITILISIGL